MHLFLYKFFIKKNDVAWLSVTCQFFYYTYIFFFLIFEMLQEVMKKREKLKGNVEIFVSYY